MPTAPLRPCAQYGCPVLVTAGRCKAHKRVYGSYTPWRSKTPPPQRLRGRANQERRDRLFSRSPFCAMCQQEGQMVMATVADHIIPLAEDGLDAESNLQALCEDCHRHKTAEESKRGVRRLWHG